VIVAVCADKGSPGATTLATVLGLVWPGDLIVVEADPAGADLPLRLYAPDRSTLRPEPTVLSLAADSRMSLPDDALPAYAQATSLDLPVIPGALSPEQFLPMRALWPQVAAELAKWPGTVIADLGRFHPGHAALPVARAATAVVLVARATVEGLYHLRDRVGELAHLLGDPVSGDNPVCVVVRAEPRGQREALAMTTRVLQGTGSPVPVVGAISDDPAGAHALWAGDLDRRLVRSALVNSAKEIAQQLLARRPELMAGAEPEAPAFEPNPWIRAYQADRATRGQP
jgi:hypothetical protein